jgi:hypothetical protein
MGWAGRGGVGKIAEYLGIQRSHCSEYLKILRAPPEILERLQSGEIQGLDPALKAMALKLPEQQAHVIERAAEIAKDEAVQEHYVKTGEVIEPVKPPVKTRHIEQAVREESDEAAPRNRKAIVSVFDQVSEAAYAKPVVKFAEFFAKWAADSRVTDKELFSYFDRAVVKQSAPKPVEKAAAKKSKAEAHSASAKK